MTSLSILLIGVSVFLVGSFLLVAENLKGVVETVRDETAVTVFLKPNATEADRADIERVAQESRLVETIRHISAPDARARFTKSWSALTTATGSLPANPFPESIELDLKRDAVGSQALPLLLQNLAAHGGAEDVQFDVEWIRRLRGVVSIVRTGGIALGILLAFGAAFTITNVVRLTILLHRDEIEILRLVGAPEVLIRGPFLLGGLAQGLMGGSLAVLALYLTFHGLLRYVATTENTLLGVFVVSFLPLRSSIVLVFGGLLAGALGGAVAVRKKNIE